MNLNLDKQPVMFDGGFEDSLLMMGGFGWRIIVIRGCYRRMPSSTRVDQRAYVLFLKGMRRPQLR